IFRQDAVLHETDHTVLRILVKFSRHIPDFPIYSNGTKPGTLHQERMKNVVALAKQGNWSEASEEFREQTGADIKMSVFAAQIASIV
ncbi:hypothetical protein QQA07_11615, partial [Corynebacterium accolens]|nr:hypothetical protein [Corynebacterium accolens]MDK8785309.1 hypothetical protein [Corynebacterium accolens]